MRNLKRALSLALAAVMVIGMMVVGAGAASYNDFTDKDEIKNADAVSMVTELGIINGLPNGTFGPTQNIDRASFVKMVALAYNGGKEPMLPSGAKVSYVDTAGTWASQYIEYCTNLGFVAGDGTTGKFNPTAPVTVSQAAKMLLVALGYNADIEGYVGYDWQMNVDANANTAGLYDELSGDTSANLTRDNAAQMIYNALSATMVKYEGVYDLTTGTMKPQLTDKDMKTLLEQKFGAVKLEGVVTSNEFASLTSNTSEDEGKTYIDLNDTTLGVASGLFKASTGEEALGRTVTLYVKPGNTTAASKATVLGSIIINDTNKVVTVTSSKTAKGMTDLLDDEKLDLVATTKYCENYGVAHTTDTNSIAVTNVAGVELTFIDNDEDGKVDYVLQFAKTFGKVTNYNTTGKGSISITAQNRNGALTGTAPNMTDTSAASKVNGFDDVKKDDYVFFYTIDGVKTVEKADSIEVNVTAIKNTKVTADGVTYEQSGLVTAVNDSAQALKDAVQAGKSAVFYLDGGKNVVYVTDVDTTVNFLYVAAIDNNWSSISNTDRVRTVLADGSTMVVNAYVKSGSTKSRPAVGAYAYSVNDDGTYELKAVTANNNISTTYAEVATITGITKGVAALAGSAAIANSDTIFVVSDNDASPSYNVYTGIANVPTLQTGNGHTFTARAVTKNNVAKVVFVSDSDITGTAKTIYVLNQYPTITSNSGKSVYTYDVVYEGEYRQMTGSNATLFGSTGLFTGVNVNGDKITNSGSLAANQGAAATKNSAGLVSNGIQYTAGVVDYVVDSKTVFLTVDNGEDGANMVAGADLASIVIDGVNASNTSNILIVPGSSADGRTGCADYVYILN